MHCVFEIFLFLCLRSSAFTAVGLPTSLPLLAAPPIYTGKAATTQTEVLLWTARTILSAKLRPRSGDLSQRQTDMEVQFVSMSTNQ